MNIHMARGKILQLLVTICIFMSGLYLQKNYFHSVYL